MASYVPAATHTHPPLPKRSLSPRVFVWFYIMYSPGAHEAQSVQLHTIGTVPWWSPSTLPQALMSSSDKWVNTLASLLLGL